MRFSSYKKLEGICHHGAVASSCHQQIQGTQDDAKLHEMAHNILSVVFGFNLGIDWASAGRGEAHKSKIV